MQCYDLSKHVCVRYDLFTNVANSYDVVTTIYAHVASQNISSFDNWHTDGQHDFLIIIEDEVLNFAADIHRNT